MKFLSDAPKLTPIGETQIISAISSVSFSLKETPK